LEKHLHIVQICILAALVLYLFKRDFLTRDSDEPKKEIIVSYGVPALEIPDEVTFAGESVPLGDPDVRERLDRELHVNTFWHSNTIFLLKRGHRWLPQIEAILQKYDIPPDLKYLAVIESDLQNKVSPSQAVGFWQLLKPTAKEFGLEVNNEVDERYHQLKSTEAACKYLRRSLRKFGNWTNAAASYNAGMRGLDRAMSRQGVDSYYDLLLNEETSRYVFRAIAIKLIFEHPDRYGFNIPEHQLYDQEALRDLEVTSSISNLREYAFDQGINYKVLKRHNPWLRKNTLSVRKGKNYLIRVPISGTPGDIAINKQIEEDTVDETGDTTVFSDEGSKPGK
jgi:hypothetical protein